ncbi:MAG TPA: ribosome recycling factor [Candidatus Dormibacteraeota bacterium]|nr:ribosome recycling factor [Candidatus Dormibacteraeota bacterium]
MSDDLLRETQQRMAKSVDALHRELGSIRTGRASPALIEHLQVEVYDSHMPLNQVASISAPEAHLLLVQPWDRNNLAAIEKVLRRSELGLNPGNDGQVIRLPVPPLNEERRREFVQMVKHRAEEARVAVRNIRRDDLEQLRRLEHDKEISIDQSQRAQVQLQKVTDGFIEEIEEVARRKEAELLEV